MLGLLIQHIVKQTEPKGIAINAVGQAVEPLNDAPIGTPTNLHPGFGSTDVDSAPLGESLGLSLEDVPARLTLSGRTASAPGIDAAYSSDANTNLPLGDGGGLSLGTGKGRGGGLGGRTPGRRGQLAKSGGGSAQSEEAVERGLKWLVAHQHEDGGWRFIFDGAPCENLCRNPGAENSTTGATALALLPFYGAGYTHKEGPYAEQLNRGLYYLVRPDARHAARWRFARRNDVRPGHFDHRAVRSLRDVERREATALHKTRSILLCTHKTNKPAAGAIFRARPAIRR